MVLVDETEYPVNTFGVVALLAWLIPRVYIDWSRALLAVRKNHKKNGGADDGGELEHQLGRVQMHAFLGIATWSTIMIVASCLCAKYSVGMDSRMVLILGGFSRIVTAAVSFFVSLELPQWLGVYDYISIILDNEKAKDTTNRNRRTSTTPTLTTTTPAFSLRVTLFELQWAIMGEYARVFWIVQVFSCGNDPSWGLPVSYSVGLVLGIFVTYGVYFGRTRLSPKRRIQTTYFCMLFLSVMACVLFGYGALFIQDVWNPDQSIRHVRTVSAVTCLVAAAIAAGCHFVAYKIAKRKAIDKQARLEAGEKIPESRFHSELFAPRTVSSAVHRAANAI